ncbi:hypothetical protein SK128_003443 [Halocaridina rubra]|uniref:Choline transporter-like protein n=1 Tax=Halocaridina rubra TaxID=373956 RepID=A0AAN8X4Z0_HALRR
MFDNLLQIAKPIIKKRKYAIASVKKKNNGIVSSAGHEMVPRVCSVLDSPICCGLSTPHDSWSCCNLVFYKKLEKRITAGNAVCGYLLKCCQCCLWCFEKFLKFLTKNAYIEIAIYGYGFCKSAQKAFSVLVNNALRVVALNYIGAFVLFLAKIAVVVPTVFIGIEIMKTLGDLVTYAWVPILLASLFTFFVAHCFLSVYEMTIDTLFLCFCEDCEKNDGIQKPYFMSKGLMIFVENSKKALEALEQNNTQPQQQQAWTTNVQPNNVYGIPVAQPPPGQLPGYIHGGMTPLHPAYPANSIPPSPSKMLAPPGR